MRGRKRKLPADFEPAPWVGSPIQPTVSDHDEDREPGVVPREVQPEDLEREHGRDELMAERGPDADAVLDEEYGDDEDGDGQDLVHDLQVLFQDHQHQHGEQQQQDPRQPQQEDQGGPEQDPDDIYVDDDDDFLEERPNEVESKCFSILHGLHEITS